MSEGAVSAPLGLFGGTFDPVHYGHLRLAEEAVDQLGLSRVRWIPAGRPTAREQPQASATERLAMVALAIVDNPRFELDRAEVDADRLSYTVPTLERLREAQECGAQRPLVLLLGADAFSGLVHWHRWEQIFALAHVAVAHRPGFPVDPAHLPDALAAIYRQRHCADAAALGAAPAGRIATFAMTQLDISATKIRALRSKGASARYLLPETLLGFIQDHHLYPES